MTSSTPLRPGRRATAPPTVPAPPGTPFSWASGHRDELRAALAEHGAVLVRGLDLRDAGQVGAVAGGLGGVPAAEREAFAARTVHREGVYSSAAWPPQQPMCMHHELSYLQDCPGLLLIACLTAADAGGETGTADGSAVLAALPEDLVRRFETEGWLLTRTYGADIGATVEQSFGTGDPAAVDAYCRAHGITAEWGPDGSLRTRQRRAAVIRHPADGRRCWFNQIAFLSRWTLDPEVREYLTDVHGPDALPFDTRYGGGDPVDEETVRLLNEVYAEHTAPHSWRAGDLLILDNLRTAHSREPYQGSRDMVVAMADPVRPSALAPTPR
ncbi:TauD/TfdA family dioxygenase [Streptomyces sp. ODS05-4]|uniref:TauD/TfdA family dioxygenase n=1 Tax=Streptomyces sp. ODS05-4 TaxID=2944939 RepID=UPI00210DDCCE|nr:TauD/TfdA family dioxygenase [Streptomyces sp. ODS05-4]